LSLRLGLAIEGQEGVSWPQWRTLAALAEEHGFFGLYRSDHYLSERIGSNRDALEAWGTISALAATTSSIRLGTLVSPVTFRHPSVLAKLVATADHISSGRVELGMGTGWFAAEHSAYGFDLPAPRTRMTMLEEQVEIIKRSWGATPFSFVGDHYRILDLDARPKPLQQPAPKLILGGNGGPRSTALAARWADEYNLSDPTDERIRSQKAALADACERIGRDPATLMLSVATGIVAGAEPAEVADRAARVAAFLHDPAAAAETGAAALPPYWLIGTAGQILERLRTLASIGVDKVLLSLPLHDDLEMITFIGREILPAAHAASS
jgi:F420-dependent oxidoreductase-like protein